MKEKSCQQPRSMSKLQKAGRRGDRERKLTDAKTIRVVSSQPLYDRHHQLKIPPIVLARVKDGTLYMPTATAMPPGIRACQRLLFVEVVRIAVVMANSRADTIAHSFA